MSATARVTGHARNTLARGLERASTAAKRVNQRMLRDFASIELPAEERCTVIGTKSRATWVVAAIAVCSRLWAVYRLRVLGQWFDGIRFYAAASSPRRSRRTWAGLR